jgi:hypothetical protein
MDGAVAVNKVDISDCRIRIADFDFWREPLCKKIRGFHDIEAPYFFILFSESAVEPEAVQLHRHPSGEKTECLKLKHHQHGSEKLGF